MELESQRLSLLASIHELEQINNPEQHNATRLGELKQEYNQIIEKLRYQRHGNNICDPLVKFPPEVWIPIIQYAMERIRRIDYVSTSATLYSCMFVSKRWYKYITEVPILWSNIELNDRDGNGQDTIILVATFLHFSQACELNLTIIGSLASWGLIRDRIALHRSRIKSIEFYPVYHYYYQQGGMESFIRKMNEILRFLSPLSLLTRLEGYSDDPKWLLEEGTPLAYVDSAAISLDMMSLPGAKTLRSIETNEDIRSVIPFMKNLHRAQNIRFYGYRDDDTANIPFVEPRDIDFSGIATLDWLSLSYWQNDLHFPVWLLTRLPNLVDLTLGLWSVQLVPFLSTLHSLNSLNILYISITRGEPPHELPPDTISPCLSLRFLNICDTGDTLEYTMEYIGELWKSLVKIFSNIRSLTVESHGIGFAYISLKSNGFQKLEKLSIEGTWGDNPPLLEGEAWFPPSLRELIIEPTDAMLTQVYSPTIECLDITLNYNHNIGQGLSISGWPKLRKLTIHTWGGLSNNATHRNLREIRLRSTASLPNDGCTNFCRDVALYPSILPSLESIALGHLPEWDIFFIMLERKNFCDQPGVVRINRVEMPDAYPKRFLKPIRDLLGGMYTERPSNWDLSLVGTADIMLDPLIPGCIGCHRTLRACDLEWNTPHRLEELRLSLPIYPEDTQNVLLTWDERAAYWSEVFRGGFGRKESCFNFRESPTVISYD